MKIEEIEEILNIFDLTYYSKELRQFKNESTNYKENISVTIDKTSLPISITLTHQYLRLDLNNLLMFKGKYIISKETSKYVIPLNYKGKSIQLLLYKDETLIDNKKKVLSIIKSYINKLFSIYESNGDVKSMKLIYYLITKLY